MRIAILSIAHDLFAPIRAGYLADRGHDVYYIGVLPGDYNPRFKAGNYTYIEIKPLIDLKFIKQLDIAFRVRRLTKNLNIDVLYIIDMLFCLCAPFSKSKKVLIENNGSDVLVLPEQNKILKPIYRWCYGFVQAVIQDSAATRRAGISYGAPEENNEIISLGVDFSTFNPSIERGRVREKLGLDKETKIVFSPRSLRPLYNIDTIIDSARFVREKYGNVKYVFAGYALDEQDLYKKRAEKTGRPEDFLFVGYLDGKTELPYYYRDADVVVSVPSSDSFPACVVEAMACRAPLIVSELPWYGEIFSPGVDMLTVPVRDPRALADAIVRVLDGNGILDTDRISRMVMDRFGIDTQNRKVEALYEKILKERPESRRSK